MTQTTTRARPRRWRSPEERSAIEREALQRAEQGSSSKNDAIVVEAFRKRGFHGVVPRRDALTYHAWRAKDRQVRRGEKGVRIVTWVPIGKAELDPVTGEEKARKKRPKYASVFHVSQTDAR